MKPQISSYLRAGFVALGMLAGFSAPALAGPSGFSAAPAVASDTSAAPVEVARRCMNGRCFDGNRRGDNWKKWDNDGGPRWSHNRRHWDNDDNWRWRHNRHYRRHNDGLGLFLGLGLGVPAYQYYAPRRTYSLSAAHVAWCRDRWRSYRAYDNTYQPYNGPRRQCVSPYS